MRDEDRSAPGRDRLLSYRKRSAIRHRLGSPYRAAKTPRQPLLPARNCRNHAK